MKPSHSKPATLTRRALLKQLGFTPLLLRSAPLFGLFPLPATRSVDVGAEFALDGLRYRPHYPVGSPLEAVLALVPPGHDAFATEVYAYEMEDVLRRWSSGLCSGNLTEAEKYLDARFQTNTFSGSRDTVLRETAGIRSTKSVFEMSLRAEREVFFPELANLAGAGKKVETAQFALTSMEVTGTAPLAVQTSVRFSMVLQRKGSREQRTGTWQLQWEQARGSHDWRLLQLRAVDEVRTQVKGAGFVDVTRKALGSAPSYAAQMLRGADTWRTLLDGASGIDVYGNNGIAAGDYDGDGRDDFYVSQPAGLPNRLYRNRGDGTFEDVTERAGVGVLDNTACALFADFLNRGRQDLLVVCGSGPLLFLNQGDGTFQRKVDAFRFAQQPLGTFTHAALADYDRDGKLDVYFCLYSYYLGLDQYHYPAPYVDARNGPPNYLMRNEGDGTFVDRTAQAGLNAENDRYSFACAWGQSEGDGAPDLYVANDFGRNNLYRNQGDGTFRAVSAEAGVQDVGAGMSASWCDVDNDGLPDLYAADMWSAAGQRVSEQPQFHAEASASQRELYRDHARGNALYRNLGGGRFRNVSRTAGAAVGGWAWGADFWDFDHDGFADLYVTNGYITAMADERMAAGSGAGEEAERVHDLDSFFWRQVVGQSPEDATPSPKYERGWNALNELIRSDRSWNGAERNVLLANNGDGTFSEISGALGMDFLEDGRAFALADVDGDGRLEVMVKNRNAPQLRLLHNAMPELGDSLALRLRGTRSNRDAIGTKVVLQSGALQQTRWLQAGTGFLAQHTKELFFGLGKGGGTATATVHWPSGLVQTFADLPRNARVEMIEGQANVTAKPFGPTAYAEAASTSGVEVRDAVPAAFGTWLLDPLKAPAFRLKDRSGAVVSLDAYAGKPVLLHLFSSAMAGFEGQLRALEGSARSAGVVQVVALDLAGADATATARVGYPVVGATEEVGGVYNIIFRYLFDRRADLPMPVSFLIDGSGMIAKVYQGALTLKTVQADAAMMPRSAAERVKVALPFPGTLYHGEFRRNDFTYGVAMFQHGYLDEAAASFRQVLVQHPDDAEAHYNLGTLSLRRNDLVEAQQSLQRTVELKPVYPEAWNNLGMIAAQQNRPAEAVKAFERALEQRPGYVTSLINLGNLYRHERAFAQAQTYLDRALKLEPEDAEANYSLGMLSAQQNDLSTASRFLQRAIALKPDYPEALNNYGVLLVREQQYPAAEEQFRAGVQRVPGYEGSYLNLARLYALQGDKTKARAVLADLLRVHPESQAGQSAVRALE